MNAEELAKSLRNIGPVCAKQLVKAGIDTPEKLRAMGAKKAYITMMEHGAFSTESFNAAYLYALEGAIRDCDWRQIPDAKKDEFKQFTKSLRNQFFG